ncbi:putative Ig domain-containing protein [Larkinella terrae]|uniref:putative Ig domain-containing protein n=1 Tax=Larkinella terrae TaxID=2025311 RepID=UPI00286DABB0|nr:putative Ig domain-containing protein [Larkinella terrae]
MTGSFDGFLYGADCSSFRGWAWDRNKPNTVFSVDIYDGDTFKATLAANEFRQDLKDAGKGNGIHAFRWTIPDELKNGQVHSLSARISGSGFTLKDGPKTVQCQTGTPPANKPPVAPTVAALTAQQGVNFTTALPVFTDPEGGTLSYGLVGLPSGLTFTSGPRQINGKPDVEGVFVLTYSATDPQGATNSVSINLTVAGSTTVVTGDFEGYLDKVECGTIRGWVWDRKKPNAPLTVEFYTGSTVWGSVVANIYRVDLLNAGKGNGVHAYSFEVPTVLKDNTSRLISARVSGSNYVLKDSGKPLACSPPAPVRLSASDATDFQVTVLGNPVSDRVTVEIRGAEGQPVRLALTDLKGQPVAEQWVEKAALVERQTVLLSGQPAGLLFLRAISGSRTVTLKLLKP